MLKQSVILISGVSMKNVIKETGNHKAQLTFVGASRSESDQTLIAVKYLVKDSSGAVPESVVIVTPFQIATNVRKGNHYPCRGSYDKRTGLLSFSFEVNGSNNFHTRTHHQFKTTVVLDNGETGLINCQVKLRGIEGKPNLTLVSQHIDGDILTANIEVRRAGGLSPDMVSKVEIVDAMGIVGSIPSSIIYNKAKAGSLEVKVKLQDSKLDGSDYALDLRVGIMESKELATISLKGTHYPVKAIQFFLREAFLDGDELIVDVNVRKAAKGLPPKVVELSKHFITALNVPTGTVQLNNIKYDAESGVVRFRTKVNVDRNEAKVYHFTSTAVVDGVEYPFELNVPMPSVGGWVIRHVRSDMTPTGLVALRFQVYGSDKLPPKSASGEKIVESLGFVSNKVLKTTYDRYYGFLSVYLEPIVDNDKDVHHRACGYANVDNVRVPFVADWVMKKLTPAVTTVTETNSGISAVINYGDNACDLTGVEQPRLYRNGRLLEQLPNSKRIDNKNKIVELTYALNKPVDEANHYTVSGMIKLTSEVERFLPYEGGVTAFIKSDGKPEVKVDCHAIGKMYEKVILNLTFPDGTHPVKIGKIEDMDFGDKVPCELYYDKEDGDLMILYPSVGLPQKKTTYVSEGKISLPDYDIHGLEFSTSITSGSDVFPITGTMELSENSIIGAVINKDGTYPKTLQIIDIKANHVVVDKNSFVYDDTTGIFGVNVKVGQATREHIRCSVSLTLAVTADGERSSHVITDGYDIEAIPEFISGESVLKAIRKDHVVEIVTPVRWSDGEVRRVELVGPYVKGGRVIGSKFNKHKKEFTTLIALDYKEGLHEYAIDFILEDELHQQECVRFTNMNYAPAASATLYSTELNIVESRLLVRWILRDCNGEIPKDYRYNEKTWINQLGINPGKVHMEYNKDKGILLADFPAKWTEGPGMRYRADTKFRFPSPDVNYHELTFDVVL